MAPLPVTAPAGQPLLAFKFGTSSTLSASTYPQASAHVFTGWLTFPLDTTASFSRSHTQQYAVQQPTLSMFPVTVRSNFPLLQLKVMKNDDMGSSHSDLQGHRERPDNLPALERVALVSPTALELLLSACLVSPTAVAFVTSVSPTLLLDGLLGISLIIRSHIGVRFLTFPLFHLPVYSAGGN